MPQTPSTRWCPTPEQLMILEEMYRSGVRTPNAAEIQQITAHLAYYGRIEGKNVFYWFQNHKARERQRLRRRLCARHQQQYAQLGVAAASAPATAAAAAAAGASTGNGVVGGGGGGGVHPAVMQLHHQSYATSSLHQSFMAQGYFQQDASAAAAHPAGMNLVGKISECTDPDAAACGAYDHRDWVQMTDGGCSASSSGEAMAMPPCCRPLKTLELFPTKSTGLKDECSSSKSSSCSTSTN